MGRHAHPSWSQRVSAGWGERLRHWAAAARRPQGLRLPPQGRLAAGLLVAAAAVYAGMFLLARPHPGRLSATQGPATPSRVGASSAVSSATPAGASSAVPAMVPSPAPAAAAAPNPPAAATAAALVHVPAPAPAVPARVGAEASSASGAATGASVAGVPASGAVQPPPALLAPVAGPLLAGFGWAFSSVFADWQEHTGVDLQATVGQEAVAPAAGIVAAVRHDSLWGYVVSVALGDGYSTNVSALASVAVHEGEAVRAGQTLGAVGASPPAESGLPPHVFWQLFSGTRPIDPLGP